MNGNPRTVLEEAAAFAAGLSYEALPPSVVARARLQLASVLAACHAGALEPKAQAARELALASRGGEATVLPHGGRAPLHLAVFANAVHSIAFDYDDYLFLGHTGHSSVLGALAAAEARGGTLRDALVGQVAANEIAGRLGITCALGPLNGQAWTFLHLAGAAVASGKVLGLSSPQLANALALSLSQPHLAMMPAFLGSDAKLLGAALPAADGVLCAQLALRGFHGFTGVLEHPRGFAASFSFAPVKGAFSGLGTAWLTDTLAVKPLPGCAYLTTTAEAALDCLTQFRRQKGYPLMSSEIESVELRCSLLTALVDALSAEASEGPLTPLEVTFSARLTAAVALLNGRLSVEDLTPSALAKQEPRVRDLARRVRLVLDPDLTGAALSSFDASVGLGRALKSLGPSGLTRVARGFARTFGASLPSGPAGLARNIAHLAAALGGGSAEPWTLPEKGFDGFSWPFGVKLALRLRNGATLLAERTSPAGGPSDSTQPEVARQKLERETARHLDAAQRRALVDAVLNGDPLVPASTVTRLATPRARAEIR